MTFSKSIWFSLNILFVSSTLPLFINFLNNTTSQTSEHKVSQQTGDVKSSGRLVTQYKSNFPKPKKSLFADYKKKYADTDIKIDLKNLSKYNFNIDYTNYDSDFKKHTYSFDSKKNSNQFIIKVAVFKLQNLSVRIHLPFQKITSIIFMGNLKMLSFKQVNPESITYSIVASGLDTDAKINFYQRYSDRSEPKKILINQFAYFNVYNASNNLKSFMSGNGGIIAFLIIYSLLEIAFESFIGLVTANLKADAEINSLPFTTSEMKRSIYRTNSIINFTSVVSTISQISIVESISAFAASKYSKSLVQNIISGDFINIENYIDRNININPFHSQANTHTGKYDLLSGLQVL